MKLKENDLIISSFFAMLMLTIINLYILLTVLPTYARLYSDLAIALPPLTTLYISLSHFILKGILLVYPLIFIGFVICAVLGFVLKKKSILAKIYILIASLLLISALLSVFAIRSPLIKVTKALPPTEATSELEKSNK